MEGRDKHFRILATLERLYGGFTLQASMQEGRLRLPFLFYKYIFIEHLLYAKRCRAKDPIVNKTESLPM